MRYPYAIAKDWKKLVIYHNKGRIGSPRIVFVRAGGPGHPIDGEINVSKGCLIRNRRICQDFAEMVPNLYDLNSVKTLTFTTEDWNSTSISFDLRYPKVVRKGEEEQ